MSLSPEAEARVARALSAYIRDTPVRELPGDLKKFRSLRPQAVAARAADVIGVLDDEALRALVVEWLDDKPTLSKREAGVLRLASARPEGWKQEIESLTPKSRPKESADRDVELLRDRVERERKKAIQARDDARKAKEEARLTVQAERRRAADLERDVRTLGDELVKTRTRVGELEAKANKESEARAREIRRERRDADRARRERDELKEELRAARKAAAELRRTIRDLERKVTSSRPKPRTTERSKADAPARRRPLRPPPGLFEEAPESLVAWLQAPDVHVLIDGYNVTKAEDGFGDLHLPAQRNRLIDEVARLGVKYEVVPTIVFDGSDVAPGTRRRKKLPVKVEYSKADEIADDHLIARLRGLPPDPVIVVTNDRELQERARAEGATVATSNQLLALVR